MIIKCKVCNFRFVSKKDNLSELIREKEEHSTLTGHQVVYLLTLGAKVIEKPTPQNVYKCFCRTCWDNNNLAVTYETISQLDAKRFIEVHNTNKAGREGKLYQYHEFDMVTSLFETLVRDVIGKSQVIKKMYEQELEPADIDFTEKRFVKGDEELAFYLQSAGARDAETRIAYHIYKFRCPVCNNEILSGEEQYDAELVDKRFDIMLSHMRILHAVNEDDSSMTLNILQMCLLYQRNVYSMKGIGVSDRHKKTDKKSQALRTLNKTGVPMSLLADMFDLDNTRVGRFSYRGMEILGKPKWVESIDGH